MTTWPVAKLTPDAGARRVGGGWRVIFAETVLPRQVAVMVTGVLVVTCRVVIVKLTSWPAAVTLAGTDAAGELLARVTAHRLDPPVVAAGGKAAERRRGDLRRHG